MHTVPCGKIDERQSLSFDLLRCILLCQVVLGHLGAISLPPVSQLMQFHMGWYGIPFRMVTRFGREAAFVFVYLSGFFVGGPILANKLAGRTNHVRRFVQKRLFRILPTLACAVCLTAALDSLAQFGFGLKAAYAGYPVYDMASHLTLPIVLGNLLCLQPTFAGVVGSNGPLWTLGYIVQFYAAGFLALAYWPRSSARRAGLVALLLAIATLRPEWGALFLVWLVGAGVRNWSLPKVPAIVAAAAVVLLMLAANRSPEFVSLLLSCLAGVFATSWAMEYRGSYNSASKSIIEHTAQLAYPAYAIHFPTVFFLYEVVFRGQTQTLAYWTLYLTAALAATAALSAGLLRLDRRLAAREAPAPARTVIQPGEAIPAGNSQLT